MTQPDQKPPQRSEAIEKLIEEVTTHCYGLRDLGTAARAELTAMRDELERVKGASLTDKAEIERLMEHFHYGADDHKWIPGTTVVDAILAEVDQRRTQLATQSARMASLEAEAATMREALEAVGQQLECPARNTTATSHRRDGSVIISSDVRAMVKAALSTK